jgi:hypothetical protein
MTATHNRASDKSAEIGAILESIQELASCGVSDPGHGQMVAMFHACELMARTARSIAESIELEALAAMNAGAKQ